MQLRQAAVIFLTSTVVLTQLSGCAAVAPDKGVENLDDVTAVIADGKDTVDINGNEYDISGATSNSTEEEVSEPQVVEMPQDMLHDLFKEQYEEAKACKKMDKDYGTDAYDLYKKLPAGDIGTQEDANVYNYVKIKVYGYGGGGIGRDSLGGDGFGSDVKYYGKYNLPTDGFAQYVSWRQQYEASLNKSNSPTAQEPSQQPSNNNNTSSSGNQSQPSGGSTPSNNTGSNSSGIPAPPPGFDPDTWYESWKGGLDEQLPKPDYEIIG